MNNRPMLPTEVAELWGIDATLVTRLCRAGRVPGAQQFGRIWLIPAGTQKPQKMKTGPVPGKKYGKRRKRQKKVSP